MKIADAVKILNEPTGSHIDNIYIPSVGREVMFKPLTTADVKTLTRLNFLTTFDLNIEGLKLGLFDKLCAEDLSDTAIKNDKRRNFISCNISKNNNTIRLSCIFNWY